MTLLSVNPRVPTGVNISHFYRGFTILIEKSDSEYSCLLSNLFTFTDDEQLSYHKIKYDRIKETAIN